MTILVQRKGSEMKNIPVVMIIFGGSGDLAHRKLYPALFNLYEQGLIHDNFAVIGTARRPWSHEYLREQVSDAIHETHDTVDENELKAFASHFYYQSHDVTNVEHYEILKTWHKSSMIVIVHKAIVSSTWLWHQDSLAQ